ncbi:MAG: radical SAM protein, partial [Clostridia bacterium]|nr:radical SAM protein [Clostridia bacterium]
CLFSRDAEIMDYVAESKKRYGYPKVFRVFFTKNKFDFVFEIGTKLVEYGLERAMTISFQTMYPEAMANVGRRNISTEDFRRLMLRYNERQIPTYTELIIGLPGETYESFCEGFGALLENGQHFAVSAYPCEILPSSELGQPWYLEKYQIKSLRIPFRAIHTTPGEQEDDITEYGDYVIATYSMNETDWVRANLFSVYAQGLHNLGLLRAVAIYCRNELNVPYVSFYRTLIGDSAARAGGVLGRLYRLIHGLCYGVLEGKNAFVAPVPDTEGLLWGFDEILFLEAYRDLSGFYREIGAWLRERFGGFEALDALLRYQQDIVKKIGADEAVIASEYDFYTYFNRIYRNECAALEKRPIRLTVKDPAPVSSFAQLARETMWYGRNRRETDYSSSHYSVDFTKNV